MTEAARTLKIGRSTAYEALAADADDRAGDQTELDRVLLAARARQIQE